jgi:RNA polymerase sigma-70 factor, ECF subfamily
MSLSADPSVPVPTDLDVVDEVRAGDRARFSELVRRHNQRLYRACRAVLGDDAEAEDAVQAAWVSAFRALAGFRGDAAFATWVTRIAVREAMSRRRGRERLALVELEDVPGTGTPETAAIDEELGRLIGERLDTLSEGLRTVLVLRDVLELDTAETASCLGIGEEAVRVRLHRARHAMAARLEEVIGRGLPATWRFDGERCARITARVMAAVLSN